MKEGRGKREGAPSTPLPPVPAPLVGNCPGGEGGDKAPPGDEDAGELREEAPAEEEEDDNDEDWGELKLPSTRAPLPAAEMLRLKMLNL